VEGHVKISQGHVQIRLHLIIRVSALGEWMDNKKDSPAPIAREAGAQVNRYLHSFLQHGMAGQEGLVLMVEGPHDPDKKPWYRGQAILHEASKIYHRDVLYCRATPEGNEVQVSLFDQKPELLSEDEFAHALDLSLRVLPLSKAAFNDIYLSWQATVNLKEKTATVHPL